MAERPLRHLLGRRPVAGPVEGVGEPAGQPPVLDGSGGDTGDRLGEQLRRHRGRLADQRVGRGGQPVQHPLVHRPGSPGRVRADGRPLDLDGHARRRLPGTGLVPAARTLDLVGQAIGCARGLAGCGTRAAERAEQLPGHPVRCRAGRGERVPGVAVPGGAHRGGHLGVERLPDQRVPEREADAGIGQHPHRPGLVERGDQGGDGPAEHRGQVGDPELHSEQRRRAEHLPRRRGDEAEPVRDGAGQRVGHGAVRELGGARRRDRDAARPCERGQHLGEVERIARRPGGEAEQPGVRSAAGQRADELGHRGLRERAELDPMRIVYRAPQREQVLSLRYRAGHADEQQRHLVRGPGEPAPELDGGRVCPVQVVDHQDHGLRRWSRRW